MSHEKMPSIACFLGRGPLVLMILWSSYLLQHRLHAQNATPQNPAAANATPGTSNANVAAPVSSAGGQGTTTPAAQPSEIADPNWPDLTIPKDATAAFLEDFIRRTKGLQPRTTAQYLQMQRAIREAAKRILENLKDRESPIFKQAEADFISSSVMMIGNDGPDAQRKTFERFRDYLIGKQKLDANDLQMAMLAGQNLEQLTDTSLAKEAYAKFSEIIESKKDNSLDAIVQIFRASAVRLDLPGKEMRITGQTITGDDFDSRAWHGKIVLVYYWGSQIKPCVEEYPYIRKVYLDYRDKGFEIIGISIDAEREQLSKYLREQEVPWINLWDDMSKGSHPSLQKYGINAFPTMILLDREGKVITLEARGRILGAALEKLLADEKPATP